MVNVKQSNPVEALLEQLSDQPEGPLIHCRLCNNPITVQGAAIDIGLQHQHRFTNPNGITYSIRCFNSAPGCNISGMPTTEYSWFGGYQWQYASCGHCDQHLGWYYLSSHWQGNHQRSFFGLIPDRLFEDDSSSQQQ